MKILASIVACVAVAIQVSEGGGGVEQSVNNEVIMINMNMANIQVSS